MIWDIAAGVLIASGILAVVAIGAYIVGWGLDERQRGVGSDDTGDGGAVIVGSLIILAALGGAAWVIFFKAHW